MADGDVGTQQPYRLQQLHGSHAILGHEFVELDDVVGRVGRDRHLELVRRLPGGTQQVQRAGFGFPRDQDPADTVAATAVDALDEVDGALELPPARGLVQRALETAAAVRHPAAGIEPRSQVGPRAEPVHFLEQAFLDPELAADLHERGDAVPQQLGHREAGVQVGAFAGAGLIGPRVAGIARGTLALARHADLQERLAEIVRPADVGDQPVRRPVAAVDVHVDETRRHQHPAGVDLPVHLAVEAAAHMQDDPVLEHHHPVAHERVAITLIADDPTAANQRTHVTPPSEERWPLSPCVLS